MFYELTYQLIVSIHTIAAARQVLGDTGNVIPIKVLDRLDNGELLVYVQGMRPE
jgi:hypothetical protein